jgi:phage-related baseplate assembly protein
MDVPVFIENDVDAIVAEMKLFYETDLGKQLPMGSPEMRLINMFAQRESLVRSQIQGACVQMLVDFAVAPALDFLGALVGVTRLSPGSSLCTLELTLTDEHTDCIIPKGLRVQSSDYLATFEIDEDIFVEAGTLTVEVSATSITPGISANGYVAGKVNNILDPHPFLVSAENINTTNSGSDQETDDSLRDRIKLAPSSFSVAGPGDAYIYFAKSASSTIIDVAVTTPVPGTVAVYPLCEGSEETPPEILAAVALILNGDKVRPTCDTVNVLSPTKIDYTLVVNVTKITGAVSDDVIAAITEILEDFTQGVSRKIGRDVLETKIKSLCMYDDTQVYDVELDSWTDKICDATEFAYCTAITVNIVGSNEG